MMKRIFDIVFSLAGIIILSPFLIVIGLIVAFDSAGGIFYLQKRVGKNNVDFYLIKFRTMVENSDRKGFLTVGSNDSRITRSGGWIRKLKLDELPQFFNILKGEMSFVGPRPEVREYVNLYTEDQLRVLSIRPGLTDYASIKYSNENEILSSFINPEKAYIEEIMQDKLRLNLRYIDSMSFSTDLKIIFMTLKKIVEH